MNTDERKKDVWLREVFRPSTGGRRGTDIVELIVRVVLSLEEGHRHPIKVFS